MVLVQIPMCNEKEVYQQSIAAVCNLDWPRSNFLVQVLDDSDDPTTQSLIREEVAKWQQTGARILYRHRVLRDGYKAGNLKSAMACSYVKDYEFVAIFDADFQPNPDFLKRTVPHFKVEQQVNGVFLNFFGFNGTAGVWRIKALEESGGWMERTTVEDMDIAVRAHLHGWKFIFLNDVEISVWKKFNLIFLFFLLRKLILPFYSFTLFCIILPMTMFVPEAELPDWVVCYIPALMSLLNILPSPKSFPFIIPYLLFENTMSVTKFNAMISGLFQLGSAYEWVLRQQQKTGSAPSLEALMVLKEEQASPKKEGKKQKKHNRIYKKELALSLLLLTAAARSLLTKQGLDLIGEQVE
ncbi:unnamed protein product [Triticum turgidum subsp. durum]|uniref:Glycosyltransferase 2-like domain-containing protein n=1 Tax=Triticum turgidum subsp. durum TaxID=4567 RepID=A0A9R0TYI4_TRITD|nr:unnamed protein product [Triticum turgidum subsp. durum]